MTTLRILFLKEGDKWAAQCLEHNIAAQGDTLPQAALSITNAIVAEMAVCRELNIGLESIPKAHEVYWKLFESKESENLPSDVVPLPLAYQVPKPELRFRASC